MAMWGQPPSAVHRSEAEVKGKIDSGIGKLWLTSERAS